MIQHSLNPHLNLKNFLPTDIPLNKGTILKNQKRDTALKIEYKLITEMSHPVVKTPIETASPFYYQLFPSLCTDENTKLITIRIPFLKDTDKIPQYTDDKFFSQTSRLCLPLNLFHSPFDKVHVHTHTGLHIAQNSFNQF